MRAVLRLIISLLLGAGALGIAGPASAAEPTPTITLDRSEVDVGEPIIVTMRGFSVNQVTIAVCGNLAKLGSSDCNMVAAQSERIRDSEETLTQLFAQAPPVPCPCLVWVFAPSSNEFAVAPLELLGHPVADVVDPDDGPLLEVSVEAQKRAVGIGPSLRAMLGGRTPYEVTVTLRNTTTVLLTGLQVSGSANRRFDDDAAILDIDPPTALEPGQTWSTTERVDLASPAMGTYHWEVIVSGAGDTVTATRSSAHVPILLWILLALLVADLIVMFVRWALRILRPRRRIHDAALNAPLEFEPIDPVLSVPR